MHNSKSGSFEDYYQILGLDRDADEKMIKSAYRRLALTYHPDKNPDDKIALERFKRITEAYGVLIDPVKREEYDQYLFQSETLNKTRMGFGSYRYADILNDIFKNPGAREVLEQMARGGSIRMDERFLRQIAAGSFLFGGIFFGFWGFSSFGYQTQDGRTHFRDSQHIIYNIFTTLKDKFKTGVVGTVRQVKGFWDSVGRESIPEDTRSPNFCLEITPEEAKQGTTKVVELKTQEGFRNYRIKIPAGIKDGVKLKITDQDSQLCYLLIKILEK